MEAFLVFCELSKKLAEEHDDNRDKIKLSSAEALGQRCSAGGGSAQEGANLS